MNNILISGITGFVGGNLKEYLQGKYKVTGISRKSNPEQGIIAYQELSEKRLNNSIAFVHLAGKAHDLKKTSNENEYFEVNTELTKSIFDTFLESKCEVFIYMSSVKAAADTVEGILTEEAETAPITAYGKSKLAAENYIISKDIPANKRVYILRPCMIHGPNNKGNLNLLYNFVSKGIPYPFGRYQNKRSFVSVENLCFIIHELLENRNIENGVYNIADDKSISTNELVLIMANTIGKPNRILKVPKFIIHILAKIGDFLPIPINSERLQKLTENYEVSNHKIIKALQKELPLSTEEGIEKTIKSFN